MSDGTLARCLSEEDAYVALVKVHDGMENELGNGKQFFQLILKLEDLGNGPQIRKGLSSLRFFFSSSNNAYLIQDIGLSNQEM